MGNTSILVRVQARGGKFLGPAIGGATISIVNLSTGETIASGVEVGTDSGIMGGSYIPGASYETINTNPGGSANPIVYWLSPDAGTPVLSASFDLDEPALFQLTAVGFNETTVSDKLYVEPGSQLTPVLIMPGLAVSAVRATIEDTQLVVEAFVTMMCGCKIAPDSPWPPTSFQVTCTVSSGGTTAAVFPLALTAQPSTFSGTVATPASGTYDVTVYALQPSTNNQGTATVALDVPAS